MMKSVKRRSSIDAAVMPEVKSPKTTVKIEPESAESGESTTNAGSTIKTETTSNAENTTIAEGKIKVETTSDDESPSNVNDATDSGNSTNTPRIESTPIILLGHKKKVLMCSWHPSEDLFGSASDDGTGCIWDVRNANPSRLVLRHSRVKRRFIVVCAICWNTEGTLVATGCYDGYARIWNNDGGLVRALGGHTGAILALKWNKHGDYLVTAGVDKTTIIWNVSTGECLQQFYCHKEYAVDVDWQSHDTFASSSGDLSIQICRLGHRQPLKTFRGHTDYIRTIAWCPQGQLLASCSQDKTLKIWSMKSDRRCHDLQAHASNIFHVEWSPTGPGTNNPNASLILASSSADATVRLWDVNRGCSLFTMSKHTKRVDSVSFSPDAKYVASGSFDKYLHIWSTQTGKLVHSYKGPSAIYEVCWNARGNKVGACTNNGTVFALDLRYL